MCGRERMEGGYDGLETPTLLEGKALVAWFGISVKTRTNYPAPHERALKPTEFTAFAEFQSRKLRPGETVHMYLHHLAISPDECSRILRANPDITTIDAAVTRAKLLLTVSVEKSALLIGCCSHRRS